MNEKKDIATASDIRELVDGFYDQVRVDPLLGGIFAGVIKDNWPAHLAKMHRFWGTVLINENSYSGAPFHPHAALPVSQAHFDRWLSLFHGTVDRLFAGPVADLAHTNAERMAGMFMMRIGRLRSDPQGFIR